MEHARVIELESELESTRRESQDQAAKVTGAWVAEQLAVKRVTTVEQGLEAAKVR